MSYNKGTAALAAGKYEKALAFLKREKEETKELYLNLGTAYNELGQYGKAKECFLKANEIGGEYPLALGNLGLLSYTLWDDKGAKAYSNRALAIDPLHYMSIWNYSLAMLREYCSGLELHDWAWKMYEYRFKTVAKISEALPRWDGKSKVGKLVVLTEQGYGDKLMFSRYLGRLREYCSELVVQCVDSMRGLYPDFTTCNEIPLDADCCVPLCNLAWIFGDEDGAEWLRGKFVGEKGDKFRVAIEWSGNPGHKNDKNRSCPVGYLAKLFRGNIEFINIRPGAKVPKGVKHVEVKDWVDSAKVIASCDLVVSVDTSLVHLAGSLGVPCLLMQPLYNTDFRWGNWKTKAANGIDVESNIWYPSVKVLENLGWEKLVDEVALRISIAEREWFIKQVLGGYTIEEYVEKVKNAQNS